jgi:hypothetical protein
LEQQSARLRKVQEFVDLARFGVVRNTSGDIPAPEWRIYTNVRASLDWQANEVILDASNETVSALLPGDSLVIWAGVRFPKWVNYVRSAKIEVTYEI